MFLCNFWRLVLLWMQYLGWYYRRWQLGTARLYRITKLAAQDLSEIENYIGQDNPVAAVNFVQKLTERFHILLDSPGIGRKRPELSPTTRSSSVGEYLILSRRVTVGIEILRLASLIKAFFNRLLNKMDDPEIWLFYTEPNCASLADASKRNCVN